MSSKFFSTENTERWNYKTSMALFISYQWTCILLYMQAFFWNTFTVYPWRDWKNAAARLIEHETSKNHLNATISFAARSKEKGRIDQELIQQAENVVKYWQEVLKRLISVIIFISERGLAFRGENQNFGSPRNGNYLGILDSYSRVWQLFERSYKKQWELWQR